MNEIRIYKDNGNWYWEEDQNNQGFGPFQSIEDTARDVITEVKFRAEKESYEEYFGTTD